MNIIGVLFMMVLVTACLPVTPSPRPDYSIDNLPPLVNVKALSAREIGLESVGNNDIWAMTDEMKAFIDKHVQHHGGDWSRLERLVNTLYNPDLFGITYQSEATQTAAEVFSSRAGNCLSYSNLFFAMARYLGLDAEFQEVFIKPSWDFKNQQLILTRHINIVVKLRYRANFIMDFLPAEQHEVRRAKEIPPNVAKAQYYNNIGVEHFLNQDFAKAYTRYIQALRLFPKGSYIWSNLGALYSRLEQFDDAERIYLIAIDINPEEMTALGNLAKLYRKTGRSEAAMGYQEKLESFQNKNPYYHYELARQAEKAHDYDSAIDHLLDAIDLKEEENDFHIMLSDMYRLKKKADRQEAQR